MHLLQSRRRFPRTLTREFVILTYVILWNLLAIEILLSRFPKSRRTLTVPDPNSYLIAPTPNP